MTVEEKRKELVRYCHGKACRDCPLKSPVCRCGMGVHFLTQRKDGSYDMSDEEINEAYRIVFTEDETNENVASNDPVNHPAHYTDGKIEVIDFIEDKKLGFHLGNAVKYIARAGKKDPTKTVQDLKKARWYLDREIARLEAAT